MNRFAFANDDASSFKLGKPQGGRVAKPGKPILVDGDGQVLDIECKDFDDAVAQAKRLARKREDDIYVYVASKRVGPSEPAVAVEDVTP